MTKNEKNNQIQYHGNLNPSKHVHFKLKKIMLWFDI